MRVGQAGGYSAAFTMMQSLGLLPITASAAATSRAPAGSGKGTSVVILGGGIAGLSSAYELGKLGYTCTLLEARERIGGRNWTVRNGTKVEFTTGFTQNCAFGEGLYQNVGPARLPSIHKTMLGYCRELGVPLEVEVNTSRSAYLQANHLDGGKTVQNRQVEYDTRGHVSELLAKCIQRGALDQELSRRRQRADGRVSEAIRGSLARSFLQGIVARRIQSKSRSGRHGRRSPRPPGYACLAVGPSLAGVDGRGRDRLAGDHVSAGRRHGPDSHGLQEKAGERDSVSARKWSRSAKTNPA